MLVADAVGRSSAGPLAGGRCGYLLTLRWLLLWALACLTSAMAWADTSAAAPASPQAAGHAPASSTHAGAGCGPRITGVHAARGEGVHILQRSQDEAPSAGPPTALPPSAGVPVTLPDRWINPGRWPGHDGEVW